MRCASRLLLLAALPLVACTVPTNPSDDAPAPSTYVAGTVTLADPTGAEEAGGATFVFRYDCANPPAPQGTGRPLDFLVIDEADYDRGVASWTFPQVPPDSCWILTGFIDRDDDFDPFVSITNQVTGGDLALSAVVVNVEPLAADGETVTPVLDVELEASTLVPLDRPAFTITDVATGEAGGAMAIGPVAGTTDNTYVQLRTTDVSSDLVDVESTAFTLVFQDDADDNGWPDDLNGDGLPDVVWPRVLFVKLDPADETGLTAVSPPVILPGVVLPLDPDDSVNLGTNRVLQSKLAGLPFDGSQVLPVTDLTVVVPPLVLTDLAARTTAPIEDVRASGTDVLGDYQIVVMNSSGQTWAIPNELAAGNAEQAARFTVAEPEEPLPPRGVVGGTITTADGEAPDGVTLVTAFDCAAPPPPEGTGSPIDLASLQPSAFVDGVASYSFGTVPAESCLIITGYVDNDATFAALYSTTQLPTAGDEQLDAVVVQTGAADGDGLVEPVLDANLTVAVTVPIEAPSFVVPEDAVMTRARSVGATDTVLLRIDAADHASAMHTTEDPVFTVEFAPDLDGNGLPDDFNGDGVPDVQWPRVLLLRLDPDDPEGVATTSPPIVLPGIVLPLDTTNPAVVETNLALQSALPGVGFEGPVGFYESLTVAVPGLVVTELATASTSPIEAVALSGAEVDGDYAIIVMNNTGQTWQIPNESVLFGATDQEAAFRVEAPDEDAPGFGSVSGTITTADASEPGGRTVLFRFACDDPPPPDGAGLPLDFLLIDADEWTGDTVDYTFTGLTAGSCQLITGFIDRDGDWDGLYGTANQASAGDFAIGARVVNVPAADPGTGLVPDVVNQGVIAGLSVPLERPAFTMVDIASAGQQAPTMEIAGSVGETESVLVQLTTADVDSPVCSATSPLFTFTFAPDLDQDGTPEDFNGDGLPDVVWPRVLVRKLDETDPAGIGVQDAPPVILPGIIVPLDPTDPFEPTTNLVIQQTLAGIPFDGSTPFPQTSLTVAVPGLVVTDPATLSTAPIEAVAGTMDVEGEYQVLVMNSSGQTWALPNEAAIFEVAGQDAVFIVE